MVVQMKTGRSLLLVMLTACATASPDTRDDLQPTRTRAALASLTVNNLTAESLGIYYRLTAPPATEVRVGHVSARSEALMAPVPAGESLILIARTPTGAELALPPRTFQPGEHSVWPIPADTRFLRPDGAS